jgi:L-fuculose-phosphate aldolase
MSPESPSPAQQVAELTRRIYARRITTASGGNLSIRDQGGDTWVTPARLDKGRLQPGDVVCVRANGEVAGKHRPSTEYPFHRAIYQHRPDIHAVAHAHCPSLVAFSLVGKIPAVRAAAQAYSVCGEVGCASYAVTQSEALGEKIAEAFAGGPNVVLMENHGAVSGGPDLLTAFQRLETLESCAQALLRTGSLGPVSLLSAGQLRQFERRENRLPELEPASPSDRELELRGELCAFVRRGCEQGMFTSRQGTLSARLDEGSFLITPHGADHYSLQADGLVLVRDGRREAGKLPGRQVRLHERIYADHPQLAAIVSAQPPNAMAYAMTGHEFELGTIAETYITLKSIAFAGFDGRLAATAKISGLLGGDTPAVLIRNEAVLTAGRTLLAAFDRLEVAEFSARASIDSASLGGLRPLSAAQIEELDRLYFPEMSD